MLTNTYAKFNGNGEEIDTSFGGDLLAILDAGQVHIGGLDDTRLAFSGLQDSLGEAT